MFCINLAFFFKRHLLFKACRHKHVLNFRIKRQTDFFSLDLSWTKGHGVLLTKLDKGHLPGVTFKKLFFYFLDQISGHISELVLGISGRVTIEPEPETGLQDQIYCNNRNTGVGRKKKTPGRRRQQRGQRNSSQA